MGAPPSERLPAYPPSDAARLTERVAGYSGTPPAAKLGIKPATSLVLLDSSDDLPLALPDG